MTHQQILTKAIQKAIDGGWYHEYISDLNWSSRDLSGWLLDLGNYPSVIFNHDFAKALFGEEEPAMGYRRDAGGYRVFGQPTTLGWKYHLQQMVIADDPIKYLGEHLDD